MKYKHRMEAKGYWTSAYTLVSLESDYSILYKSDEKMYNFFVARLKIRQCVSHDRAAIASTSPTLADFPSCVTTYSTNTKYKFFSTLQWGDTSCDSAYQCSDIPTDFFGTQWQIRVRNLNFKIFDVNSRAGF